MAVARFATAFGLLVLRLQSALVFSPGVVQNLNDVIGSLKLGVLHLLMFEKAYLQNIGVVQSEHPVPVLVQESVILHIGGDDFLALVERPRFPFCIERATLRLQVDNGLILDGILGFCCRTSLSLQMMLSLSLQMMLSLSLQMMLSARVASSRSAKRIWLALVDSPAMVGRFVRRGAESAAAMFRLPAPAVRSPAPVTGSALYCSANRTLSGL